MTYQKAFRTLIYKLELLCQCGMVVLYQKKISSLEQIQRRVRIFILGKEYSEHERLSQLNLLP